MSTKILQVCIKYYKCDMICNINSCCVWSCDTDKINAYDKIVTENKKQWENMEVKDIFT